MSMKERFLRDWKEKFCSENESQSTTNAIIPELDFNLDCKSDEDSLENNLTLCRERIKKLKQQLKLEEFLEHFLLDALHDIQMSKPRVEEQRPIQATVLNKSNSDCVKSSTYLFQSRFQQFEQLGKSNSMNECDSPNASFRKRGPKVVPRKDKQDEDEDKSSSGVLSSVQSGKTELTVGKQESAVGKILNDHSNSSTKMSKQNNESERGVKNRDLDASEQELSDMNENMPNWHDLEKTIASTLQVIESMEENTKHDDCDELDGDHSKSGNLNGEVKSGNSKDVANGKVEIVTTSEGSDESSSKSDDGLKTCDTVDEKKSLSSCKSATLLPVPFREKKLSSTTESVTGEDSGSDDESDNLFVIRQSISRASAYCTDVDASRKRLEQQAQRLSTRFSRCLGDSPQKMSIDVLKNHKKLDILMESPQVSMLDNVSDIFSSTELDAGVSDYPLTSPLLSSILDNNAGRKTQNFPTDESPIPGGHGVRPEMRKWILNSMLDSEHIYMDILDTLLDYNRTFKNLAGSPQRVVTSEDIDIIFHRISDLHQIHYTFMRDLETKMMNYSPNQQIAETFKMLAMEEYSIAPDYLRNYSKALSTIHTCRQASQTFDELTKGITSKSSADKKTLEDLLHQPIVRFQRNTLLLHDLIKYTPTIHPDYDLLQKTLKFARNFLDNLENQNSERDTPENQRYLAKHGLIVEKVGKVRKLRHVFLFNDMLIGAKQKLNNRNRIQSYEVKWYIPLMDISLEDRVNSDNDKNLVEDYKEEIEARQKKMIELQAEHKTELKKAKQAADSSKIKLRNAKVTNKNLERIRRKLLEQEAALVIASPRLAFKIYHRKVNKHYNLMMSSDYERTDWKDTIIGLLSKAQMPPYIGLTDVQNLLNNPNMLKATGAIFDKDTTYVEEEHLFGCLRVRIGKLQGLKKLSNAFCIVEVDSFSHFSMKAKTNVINQSVEPIWNEDFEIDMDGAQTLRILCYSRDKDVEKVLGRGALELRSVWLKDGEQDCSISLSNEMSISVSLRYFSREQTITRIKSTINEGYFGIRIEEIAENDGCLIPVLVTSCIEEIERRGLAEEGLYRVSGLFDAVQKLKMAFEKNSKHAVGLLKAVDINALTGLIKLFFRTLPEALFTDDLYKSFVEGIGLADPDARDKCLLSLISTLPPSNYATVIFMLDHLVRVSQQEQSNKMTVNNLATVFGPTFFRPAPGTTESQTTEQLFFFSAHEAMMQTAIMMNVLTLRCKGADFAIKM